MKARLLGFARAAVAVLVLLAVAVAGTARAAERHVGERFAAFGESLLAIESFRVHSAPRKLGMNGMELGVVTLSSQLDVASTLDRLEGVCQHGGIEAPAALLSRKLESAPARALRRLTHGILRQETEERGVVGCIDTGETLDVRTLEQRLAAVERTGDLGELGALRFVFVRRGEDATTALVLWSADSLPFLRAFPKTGDAPGLDIDGVPRPAASRRLLSATEQGSPYTLAMYEAPAGTAGDPLASYVGELERQGFTVKRLARKDAVLLRNGARTLVVCLTRPEGRPVLTIARLS